MLTQISHFDLYFNSLLILKTGFEKSRIGPNFELPLQIKLPMINLKNRRLMKL